MNECDLCGRQFTSNLPPHKVWITTKVGSFEEGDVCYTCKSRPEVLGVRQ